MNLPCNPINLLQKFQLNNSPDSTNLQKYYINNIYILPDYVPGDKYTDSTFQIQTFKNFTSEYHQKRFRTSLLNSSLSMKKGDVFRQQDYFKTINDFYKMG